MHLCSTGLWHLHWNIRILKSALSEARSIWVRHFQSLYEFTPFGLFFLGSYMGYLVVSIYVIITCSSFTFHGTQSFIYHFDFICYYVISLLLCFIIPQRYYILILFYSKCNDYYPFIYCMLYNSSYELTLYFCFKLKLRWYANYLQFGYLLNIFIYFSSVRNVDNVTLLFTILILFFTVW